MQQPGIWWNGDDLWCEGVDLAQIAAEVGTPVFVYSAAELDRRAHDYLAGAPADSDLSFATKTNNNLTLLRRLNTLGFGADVTSGGELYLSLEAGFNPQKIIYSGVGKLDHEIELALSAGIRAIHVESAQELEVIESIAAGMGVIAPIGVRFNPNIKAETHPYISTGMAEHKFGVQIPVGMGLMAHAQRSDHLRPIGVAAHIGSQIEEIAPFGEAAERLVEIGMELRSQGIAIDYIDIGGGLGINYAERPLEAQQAPHPTRISEWLELVTRPIAGNGFKFVCEPGRSLIAPAGILLTSIVYTKTQAEKRFAISDAGMNDLLRPTLYQAQHEIVEVNRRPGEQVVTDLVGPICESGDFLAKGRPLAAGIQRGDLLAVLQAGHTAFQ